MTGSSIVSSALDTFQLIAVGCVVFCTWKTQQSIQRYRDAIDHYAESLTLREKMLEEYRERLSAKEHNLNELEKTITDAKCRPSN